MGLTDDTTWKRKGEIWLESWYPTMHVTNGFSVMRGSLNKCTQKNKASTLWWGTAVLLTTNVFTRLIVRRLALFLSESGKARTLYTVTATYHKGYIQLIKLCYDAMKASRKHFSLKIIYIVACWLSDARWCYPIYTRIFPIFIASPNESVPNCVPNCGANIPVLRWIINQWWQIQVSINKNQFAASNIYSTFPCIWLLSENECFHLVSRLD